MATFRGTAGDDDFRGTSARDTFRFGENEGVDIIFGFNVFGDRIVYTDRSVDGFDDIDVSRLTLSGTTSAVIESNDQITVLWDVDPDDLDRFDFVFETGDNDGDDFDDAFDDLDDLPGELDRNDIARRVDADDQTQRLGVQVGEDRFAKATVIADDTTDTELVLTVRDGDGEIVRSFFVREDSELNLDPVIAPLDGGGFALAWTFEDDDDPEDTRILVQTYTEDGVRIGSTKRIGGDDDRHVSPLAVGLDDGGFVVVADNDASGTLIAQAFTAAGEFDGPRVTVTSGTFSDVDLVDVDGGYRVTWNDGEGDRSRSFGTDGGQPDDGTIRGTSGADRLQGTEGDDRLLGAGGDDRLFGRGGNDALNGGGGDDGLLGGAGDDVLKGSAGSDVLVGEGGNDELFGGTGADYLYGGDGDDALRGGDGRDLLRGESGRDVLIGNAGDDRLFGGADDDELRGGTGDDGLLGGAGDDVLVGGAGNDVLVGEAGRDVLSGGTGTDYLYGREGDDTLRGGEDRDVLAGDDGHDTLFGDGGNDRLSGGADDDGLYGGVGHDSLLGGAGDDVLDGGAGNDVLLGEDGSDELSGGAGTDYLYGLDGADTLRGGAGRDVLRGGAGDDVLMGGEGNDRLFGGAGDDVLYGNDGADSFTGGAGADAFVKVGGSGYAAVTDFERGTDVIVFEGTGADSFDDLTIGSNAAGDATARVGNTRIVVLGVDENDLSAADFRFTASEGDWLAQ